MLVKFTLELGLCEDVYATESHGLYSLEHHEHNVDVLKRPRDH